MRKVMCCLTSVLAVVMLMAFSIGVVQAGECVLRAFHVNNFGSPDDNYYLSMDNIGHTYVYEADTEDGLVRDFIYFSRKTKDILGVGCTVVYDVEYLWVEDLDGGTWVKLEETWDWHAWDNEGKFWYFGEDTVEYLYDEDWEPDGISTEGSWEADGDEAWPGIILLADPQPGDCVRQEYYEGEAEDMGKVLQLNGKVSIELNDGTPIQCDDCLVTKEWTQLEPGNVEHKYYAPDLGLVYIEELKEKTVIFELVDYFKGKPKPPDSPPEP